MNTLTRGESVVRQSLCAKVVGAVSLLSICLFAAGKAQAQDASCYVNWALQWDSRGEYAKAIADYNQAIAICPSDKVAYNNRGYDWYMLGNFDQAIANYTQALAICPSYGAAYNNRGVVWDKEGEKDRAFADYNQAIANDPNFAAAYNNRGTIETDRGEYDQATADFYRCLSVDPNYVTGYENLGFFQATCPDPRYRDAKKAFDNASRGYQLACGDEPYYSFNALAATYAESGDFDAARAWQEKVIELAPASDKQMQTARLELYKQNKPYRSEPKLLLGAKLEAPAGQPSKS